MTSSAGRLQLRPLTAAAAVALSPWLPEAIAAIDGRGQAVDATLTGETLAARWDQHYPAGETLVAVLSDGTAAGLARVRLVDAALVIDALTVRADRRNLGYGQEIVFALEQRAGGRCTVALAAVPPGNGLAVYFWLRTGYHPLLPPPAAGHFGIAAPRFWMTRALG